MDISSIYNIANGVPGLDSSGNLQANVILPSYAGDVGIGPAGTLARDSVSGKIYYRDGSQNYDISNQSASVADLILASGTVHQVLPSGNARTDATNLYTLMSGITAANITGARLFIYRDLNLADASTSTPIPFIYGGSVVIMPGVRIYTSGATMINPDFEDKSFGVPANLQISYFYNLGVIDISSGGSGTFFSIGNSYSCIFYISLGVCNFGVYSEGPPGAGLYFNTSSASSIMNLYGVDVKSNDTSPYVYPTTGTLNIFSGNYYVDRTQIGSAGTLNVYNGANLLQTSTDTINRYGVNRYVNARSSGTAAAVSNVESVLSFGTTSPNLVIPEAGNWKVGGTVYFKYNGATFAGSQTVSVRIRRTNNSPAYLTDPPTIVQDLNIVTTFNGSVGTVTIPEFLYRTYLSTDSLSISCVLSANPSAGTITATNANLHAIKIY